MHSALHLTVRPPEGAIRSAPSRRDWLLFGGIVAIALVEKAFRPDLPVPWLVFGLALMPTVLWRRTRPLLMVAIAFGASGLVALLRLVTGIEFVEPHATAFLVVLPYALVRWGTGRDIAIGAGFIAAAAALGFIASRSPVGDVIGGYAVLIAVAAVGVAVRYRARARSQEIEQAKSRERARIARDLHDTVAHHVSAIVIRAQAGLATSDEVGSAVAALRDIEAEASRALADMRRMVHVLRDDRPAERAPMPGIVDLQRLARARGVGPEVEVHVSGDAEGIAPAVAAAVYRIAQEAVTNAQRHARRASRIAVEVDVDDKDVRLNVSDDGKLHHGLPSATPGYGLVGMAERVEMLGGRWEAGPGPEMGWRVAATFPRQAPGA